MKTQTQETITESNKLVYKKTKLYTEGGQKYQITVNFKLADDCQNGHEDFSITADIYEVMGNGRKREYMFGCCHEEVSKHFPEVRPFIPLHLSDFEGVPMYALGNGAYHAKEGKADTVANHFRISMGYAQRLVNDSLGHDVASAVVCAQFVKDHNLQDKWKAEARKAINFLEEKTGNKFAGKGASRGVDTESILSKYEGVDVSQKGIQELVKRDNEQKRKKLLADLEQSRKKTEDKARIDYLVDVALINHGLSAENVIVYNHKQEIVVNWQHGDNKNCTYAKKWPESTVGALESVIAGNPDLFDGYTVTYINPNK